MSAPGLAVLASGEGQTLQALLDARHHLHAQVKLVISNRSQSGAAQRARQQGVDVLHLSEQTHPNSEDRDHALLAAVKERDIQFMVLAGFLKKLGPLTVTEFAGRLINTHPSLLPRHGGAGMYGSAVHQQVIAQRDGISGASIHFVSNDYDQGPVIAQREFNLEAQESAQTLETKVKALEQPLLIETLNLLLSRPTAHLEHWQAPVGFHIQLATRRHLRYLPAIEASAAQLFSATDLPDKATMLGDDDFTNALQRGLIWVMVDHQDQPVGFAIAEAIGAFFHVQEMDIAAGASGRGLGSALLRYLIEQARWRGFRHLSLTTFRDLPWNAPFYRKHGFAPCEAELPTHLKVKLRFEQSLGFDMSRRIAMHMPLANPFSKGAT